MLGNTSEARRAPPFSTPSSVRPSLQAGEGVRLTAEQSGEVRTRTVCTCEVDKARLHPILFCVHSEERPLEIRKVLRSSGEAMHKDYEVLQLFIVVDLLVNLPLDSTKR